MLTCTLAVFAQTGTGVIKGTVQDNTGAVVPSSKVTLTNVETQTVRATTATELGYYYLPSLPPGNYRLVVEASGFKKWEATARLEVGQTALIDPKLEVGSVDTVVEVADAAPVIATEGAAIGDVKDFLRIRQLPLNGRSVTTLFNLTAGVEGGGNPRVNGMKVGSTEMMLDGVSIVDRFGGGINRVSPGLDTIQEFRIETTGSSAQYSRPANVEMVTKSGTNELHGSAFETHRNNFGGLRARQKQDGNTPAKLIRNEFGVSAGGPVFLPKIYNGKNKTFWFAAYEGFRQRQSQFYQDVVPTQDMWNGNFSGIIDGTGRQTTIYDPLTTGANGTRTPFAGNTIPQNRISSFYKTVQGITHLPTNAVNPYQDINMVEYYPNILDTSSVSVKIDHRFSEKDSIAGRFSRSNRYNQLTGGRFGAPKAESTNGFGSGRGETPIHSFSLRETHIFSPTLFHDLLIASHRTANSNGTLADNVPWANNLGLPNPFGTTGWPTFCTDNFCWDADNRKDEHLTNHNIESNSTWIKGKHTVKFGGKIRQEYNNVRELQQSQGSHDFSGDWTALYIPADDTAAAYTGDGLAGMALGLPTYLSNQFNRGYFYFEQKEIGLYVTDSWKVTQRLTMELGVRWDKWTPYHEKYNRLVNVDVNNFANTFQVITPGSTRMEDIQGIPPAVLKSWSNRGLSWKTANDLGYPSSLVKADNNNFAPRIALAYRISDKFVLRGGYGEYFWTMPLSQILQTSRSNPPLNLRFETPLSTLDGTSTFAVRTAPTADMYVGKATVSTEGIISLPTSARSMFAFDGRNWADGRSQAWNVTLEREIMKNTSLRLSYLGNHGRDLEQRYSLGNREAEYNWVARTGTVPPGNRDLMRPNKDWALTAVNRTGISNTHSVQAEVEKRYSNGLTFQWFYVFARSLNTSDEGGFSAGNGAINSTGTAVAQIPEKAQILGGGANMTYDDLRKLVYYNSGTVPAHRISWNGVYDLPFGKGKKYMNSAGGFLNHVIGGWQVATIGNWRAGNWLSVSSSQYLFGDPTLNADQRLLLTYAGRQRRLWFRGNFNPTLASNVDQQALQALIPLNQADRIMRPLGPGLDNRLPQTLANGTTRLTPITDTVNWNARNFFRGPGAWNFDASLFKNFQLKEKVQLRFTADFFNALNHPLDNNPDATTGLQDLATQPNDPRIIQFSARISW
ncbi:MAG: carboxypeptidase regulatory-like domain-containing protein [Bryobacterales bacterium]|nr:carboxypeptidase regulatory-like domain-containing protein [Bryobacterales bacterium]